LASNTLNAIAYIIADAFVVNRDDLGGHWPRLRFLARLIGIGFFETLSTLPDDERANFHMRLFGANTGAGGPQSTSAGSGRGGGQ
jgi:hypothetical protein